MLHLKFAVSKHKMDWSPGTEVIKLFFMLNSAEYEICPANKSLANYFSLKIAEHENFCASKL